jgi:phosphoribosylglycinamide formyltransferase-1
MSAPPGNRSPGLLRIMEETVEQSKCRVVVFASGTGSNFRAIAEACRKNGYPAMVAGLISDNPAAGALAIAGEFGIPSHVFPVAATRGRLPEDIERAMADKCIELRADLIALAGFMRILKDPLLASFAGRIMNIHPALLPSFKGLHAQRQALEYGVKLAGCTVHFVDSSIDGGQIILQTAVPVADDDDEDSLSGRILNEEHALYPAAIALFAEGRLKIEGRRVMISPR